jgi:hypothetical protein
MTAIGDLSLEALRRSQSRCAEARDELESAVRLYWNELSAVQPEHRMKAGRRKLIQLLGAYARRIFEVRAEELVNPKAEPANLRKHLEELATEVWVQLIPPQFHFPPGIPLSELEYDEEYQSHIRGVLQNCVESWNERSAAQTEHGLSPESIITRYCKRENCTIEQLATKSGCG